MLSYKEYTRHLLNWILVSKSQVLMAWMFPSATTNEYILEITNNK